MGKDYAIESARELEILRAIVAIEFGPKILGSTHFKRDTGNTLKHPILAAIRVKEDELYAIARKAAATHYDHVVKQLDT